MKGQQPFMLLRCRPRDDAGPEFERWFREVHLRDVGKIPGIAEVYSTTMSDGVRLGFFLFESPRGVQEALQSPEAAYARGAWSAWMPKVEELRIEIFAPLLPMAIYRSMN